MTFGRDMTQIRPKNPLKKAISKAAIPNLLINTLRMLVIYFFLLRPVREIFFLLRKKISLTGPSEKKIMGVFIRSFGSKLNGSRDQRMYAKVG